MFTLYCSQSTQKIRTIDLDAKTIKLQIVSMLPLCCVVPNVSDRSLYLVIFLVGHCWPGALQNYYF